MSARPWRRYINHSSGAPFFAYHEELMSRETAVRNSMCMAPRRRTSFGIGLALAVVACSSDAPVAEDDLRGGDGPPGLDLRAVGALLRTYRDLPKDDRNRTRICAATLILENAIVTAEHCLPTADGDRFDAVFLVGPNILKPEQIVALQSWGRDTSTDAERSPGVTKFDVSYGILAKPIIGVKPIPRGKLSRTQENLVFDAVGYGAEEQNGAVTGIQRKGAVELQTFAGPWAQRFLGDDEANALAQRRADLAKTELSADEAAIAVSLFRQQLFEGHEVYVDAKATQLCKGDSGGPLLQRVGAEYKVFGVLSRGWPNCAIGGSVYATLGAVLE
jgi:Trypsin